MKLAYLINITFVIVTFIIIYFIPKFEYSTNKDYSFIIDVLCIVVGILFIIKILLNDYLDMMLW